MAYFMDLHLYKHKKAILEMKEASNRNKTRKEKLWEFKNKKKDICPEIELSYW